MLVRARIHHQKSKNLQPETFFVTYEKDFLKPILYAYFSFYSILYFFNFKLGFIIFEMGLILNWEFSFRGKKEVFHKIEFEQVLQTRTMF